MIKHLALIMDGNRRWAKKHGLAPLYGHTEGVETVKRVAAFCIERGIKYLSLYTFSLENFRRSPDEVKHLFTILAQESERGIPDFVAQGIRVVFIGEKTLFPEHVRPSIDRVEEATKQCTQLTMNFLFCYGARQEIISGIKEIARKIKQGELNEEQIDEESFKSFLWTGSMPDPDLIIRTSGYQRLSNFLLYQAAYSELYFVDCLWPELQTGHLVEAVTHYEQWQRNFGQ